LSHLAAINLAQNAGYHEVLVLEDDCAFGPDFTAAVIAAQVDTKWGICYFGHGERPLPGESSLVAWPSCCRRCMPILRRCFCVPPVRRTADRWRARVVQESTPGNSDTTRSALGCRATVKSVQPGPSPMGPNARHKARRHGFPRLESTTTGFGWYLTCHGL
jgi:hypothetical protein